MFMVSSVGGRIGNTYYLRGFFDDLIADLDEVSLSASCKIKSSMLSIVCGEGEEATH
jgi:hypothetical protein